MDAFKNSEIQRMEKGGNDSWKAFFDSHPVMLSEGRTFEDSTIKERYDGDVGEEYKDRLTAKVEGRPYVPGEKKKSVAEDSPYSRSGTPLQGAGQGRASPAESRKERNESYFARLGNENANRRDDVLPSQGGKYSGFGGGMPVSSPPLNDDGSVPGLNDFQKDPVAALSKGFGWFTSAVGKGAKTVNDSYIQPTAKSVSWFSHQREGMVQSNRGSTMDLLLVLNFLLLAS
jgi:ADP-ribosylation factor GTPase-activating protein 1